MTLRLPLILSLCCSLLSCSKNSKVGVANYPKEKENTLLSEFQIALKLRKQMVFRDAAGHGSNVGHSSVEIFFFPSSSVMVKTFGHGFSEYYGKYELHSDNKIRINIESQKWPVLILSKESDGYVLQREDGFTSLTKNISDVDHKVNRALVSDIHALALENIFPLKQK